MKIAVFVGTRPEVIKTAPVIRAFRDGSSHRVSICCTGQHREIMERALVDFGLSPDFSLDIMTENQSLACLGAKLLEGCDGLLKELDPEWVIVQGDTSTTMIASLAAFYRRIKVAHVEAGLRSFDPHSPFPEEVNRKVTGMIADLHFAPTERARRNLMAEGVSPDAVHVTGNTGIDALLWMRTRLRDEASHLHPRVGKAVEQGKRIVLMTCHRRESFGPPLKQILKAVKDIADSRTDCFFVYPLHPNPNVREVARDALSGYDNILLLEALPYVEFVAILDASYIVLTDSGGVQEEAPSFGKPVLVLRDVTERPEGLEAGVACLVGTESRTITSKVNQLLDNRTDYDAMAGSTSPYGDGHAAERIRAALHE